MGKLHLIGFVFGVEGTLGESEGADAAVSAGVALEGVAGGEGVLGAELEVSSRREAESAGRVADVLHKRNRVEGGICIAHYI